MDRADRHSLATILLDAPAWARIGLTVRDHHLRERAADALAAVIIERLDPVPSPDPRQILLPL